MTQPKETDLATALVTMVEERVAPEAALLRRRIERANAYMDGVVAPNMHTLSSIRRYLSGENDDLEV